MSSARNQSVTSSGPGVTWSAKSCSSNERSVHGFYTNANSTVSAPSTSRPGIDESVLQCPAEGGKNQVSFDGDLSNIENPDVFLSLYMVNQKLGACYYDSDVQILYVMKDIIEDNNFTMLKKLLLQVLPTVILVSTKQKEEFIECIKNLGEVQGQEESQQRWNVELCPANTFNYDMAKRKILSMSGLPGLTDQMDDEDRHLYFSSRIAFEDTNMICSVGSLLRHLDRVRPGVELETDTPVPILFMKIFTLDDVMSVDEYTYSSLQIFQREFHPSVYKAGGTKEGLSLFGILNGTKSQQGHQLLKTWFLRPSTDLKTLEERQKCISFFTQTRNMEALNTLQDCLKSTKNIMRILGKMKSCGINVRDWQHLYKTIFHAICIGDICKGLSKDLHIIQEINETFSKELLSLGNLIKHIIDFEESAFLQHFVVKTGVDEELDERKRTFDGIPNLMTKVAQSELSKLNRSITKCSVTYLPQLGYLLNLPLTDDMKEAGNYNIDPLLEFKFMADEVVYYKSAGTQELDDQLGDLQCDIRDQETQIMHRLQDTILQYSEVLHKVIQLSAELDCLLALATSAKELNLVCPELLPREQDVLYIEEGRHLLQELCVAQFVSNTSHLSTEEGKMRILTGPNASGKSVYMKQVGLIVYMAHIGSFVPAVSAKISIKSGIYTRIHTRETVSVPLSTFMIDLNQIVTSVNNADETALVIIDEFGKGTSATDGLALLASVLQFWSDENNQRPMVLVSTHFHQIRKTVSPSSYVKYQTLDVMHGEDEELVFLYSLKEGYVEYSYAAHVARSVGIQADIVQRAKEITDCILKEQPIAKKNHPYKQREEEELIKIADEFLTMDLSDENVVGLFIRRLCEEINEASAMEVEE